MKFVLLILVILGKLCASFDVKPVDGELLRSLFASPVEADTFDASHTAYLDEQCAIDCLTNLACVAYSYNQTASICTLHLNKTTDASGRRREVTSANALDVNSFVGCNVQACSNAGALFCSSSKSSGLCLCDPSRAKGDACKTRIVYGLTEWNEWSSCSASCDEGW